MARAALDWSVRDLAAKAAVHRNTITRLEAGGQGEPRTIDALRSAFEAAGVEFTNGNEPGVKLRAKKP
jgi:transcriptional regulator with XRE-family HTH domain